MRFGPPVRFARRPDGHNLAYQVLGDAELDLVFLLGYATHLGLLWEEPSVAGFLHKLAAFSRLILLDRLGSGLSDRGPTDQTFEDDMDDVALVLDGVGSERAALFGCALGGRLALLFAATYPERTSAVVTFAAHPASMRDEDYPWGSSQDQREQLLASIRGGSGGLSDSLPRMAPHEAADPSFRHWWQMTTGRRSRRQRPTRSSWRSVRWTSAGCWGRSACRPCCYTGAGTGGWTCTPAATWPSGSPGPGWWNFPATTTCRASATRTPWWR